MENRVIEGENPVSCYIFCNRKVFLESCTLEMVHQIWGDYPITLNIVQRLIANKYCEGKMKSIVKTSLKVHETVDMEANEPSFHW